MVMNNSIKNSYFFNAFFWSTLSKVLNAVFGFVSVPLLLGYFGKAEYGLLSIATACNGYMHLMDLGMNTGAVKFFSQWEAEGKRDLIYRVAKTNVTFYFIISIINILGLIALAVWGESLFSVTHEQFIQLRYCFLILAIFASISWISTVYTQLLTAFKKVAYTMQVQTVLVILKGFLIASVFLFDLSLVSYFFYLTLIVALAIIPQMIKCRKEGLIDSFKPAYYWGDFKVVMIFSIAIFALSLFQVTATQSRPIILSIFADHGAETVAEFRIVEVIPQFIIMVCGSFVGIFLPKSSEMIIQNTKQEIQAYVNRWTTLTTIIICVFSFPFIVGAKDILCAYVGEDYAYLSIWLQIWCVCLIIQEHSTPAYSFILANGKTKTLVIATAIACVLSIIINALLCQLFSVGSAVIGYVVYLLILVFVYYLYIYKYYLDLSRIPILLAFLKPFAIGAICCILPFAINDMLVDVICPVNRFQYLLCFLIKVVVWIVPFFMSLIITKQFSLSMLPIRNSNKVSNK